MCQSEVAPGKNCWGTKIFKLPTVSEASKIFMDHTFLIGSNMTSKLQKCQQCIAIFKNASANRVGDSGNWPRHPWCQSVVGKSVQMIDNVDDI